VDPHLRTLANRHVILAPMSSSRTAHLRISIDEGAGVKHDQLRDAIRAKIERGTLAPGDRLPPVRTAAMELGLAPNTVARAYRQLEDAGWLIGRGRAGTFVPDSLPAPQDAGGALDAAARAYLRRARELGFDRTAALDAVRSRS
jgi:DNA-binding transcriptional regulator YhcF (GntR family)